MRAQETARRIVRGRLDLDYLVVDDEAGTVVPQAITVSLRWSAAEPTVVIGTFPGTTSPIRWVLGRDLLTDGCDRPVGIGDVSVLPDPFVPGAAELVLSTDSGRACLRFSTCDLARFLERIDAAELAGSRPRAGTESTQYELWPGDPR